ncbi:hypothetical protein [Mesonia sp. HuA40]|uniref:hypothetical protein n=1 Tax=Mesonia sp. HuA40 TaxID=2602761 RepID=UPI0011C7526A|nr:hypothetical protein [Mesonia sp. HuA40]TXK71486.1 hypothetical protein FT993_08765 [Mesonia sp. HuA40]
MKRIFSLPFLLIFSVLIGLISCQNKSDKSKENSFLEKQTNILQKDIILPTSTQVKLSKKTQDTANTWADFKTFENELENLKSSHYQDLVENATNLANIAKQLNDSVPLVFKENAIAARLNVLYTHTKMLEQVSQRQVKDTTLLKNNLEKVIIAFNNLKTQLNEVFLPSIEEFEAELLESIKSKDSVATKE